MINFSNWQWETTNNNNNNNENNNNNNENNNNNNNEKLITISNIKNRQNYEKRSIKVSIISALLYNYVFQLVHQRSHLFTGFMRDPLLHLKTEAKSSLFWSAPITLLNNKQTNLNITTKPYHSIDGETSVEYYQHTRAHQYMCG